MSNDKYTKVILTIIALCLIILAADKIYEVAVPTAEAALLEPWIVPCYTRLDKPTMSQYQPTVHAYSQGKCLAVKSFD